MKRYKIIQTYTQVDYCFVYARNKDEALTKAESKGRWKDDQTYDYEMSISD